MIDEELIQRAARRLAELAPAPARIILFGSRARGDAGEASDLDLLVIEREVKSRRREQARLRVALGDIGVPVDLIVVSEGHVEEWGGVRNTVINEALTEGRVLAST